MKTAKFLALALVLAVAGLSQAEPLSSGLAIELLPGYKHEKLQGIDSIVGKFTSKQGVEIGYEIGTVTPPGKPQFGGGYSDRAQGIPAKNREWLKERTIGGRKVSIAYGKDQQLIVSTQFDKVGINFHAVAKTPEEIADVLLTTLTVADKPIK